MPTAGLEPTQIWVKHTYNLVEKLQLRPPIGRGLKHQCAPDPVSYSIPRISSPSPCSLILGLPIDAKKKSKPHFFTILEYCTPK